MKEYVLCEFFIELENQDLIEILKNQGDNFVVNDSHYEVEYYTDSYVDRKWIRIFGKISTQYATILKLQNPMLAERMKISYISDDLKDKYRTK